MKYISLYVLGSVVLSCSSKPSKVGKGEGSKNDTPVQVEVDSKPLLPPMQAIEKKKEDCLKEGFKNANLPSKIEGYNREKFVSLLTVVQRCELVASDISAVDL